MTTSAPSSPKRPRTDEELASAASPPKRPRLADLKRARDEAYRAYRDTVRAIEGHPEFARDVLPPVLARRFLDTGRLTDVCVQLVLYEKVTMTFCLDGVRHIAWGWYDQEGKRWCGRDISIGHDLEAVVADPKRYSDDVVLQTLLETRARGGEFLGQARPLVEVEGDLIALAFIKLSDTE